MQYFYSDQNDSCVLTLQTWLLYWISDALLFMSTIRKKKKNDPEQLLYMFASLCHIFLRKYPYIINCFYFKKFSHHTKGCITCDTKTHDTVVKVRPATCEKAKKC